MTISFHRKTVIQNFTRVSLVMSLKFKPQCLFALCYTLLFSLPAWADECIDWNDSYAARHLLVGNIMIETSDIFNLTNPKESSLLHRTVNQLHIETKESVISNQLLFSTGDVFQLHKIHESERLLRANNYIKDASVTPVELCGDRVNIKVVTSDKWTLTPGVSLGRSGGNNKSGIEIEEHNFLGLGKSVSLSYKNNSERKSTLLAYTDPQLWGSRKRLYAAMQDSSDGSGSEFDLRLPFYEFDSRRSWGVNAFNIKQEASLYDQGVVVDKLKEDKERYSLFYGWSKGRQDDHATRLKLGWQYTHNTYNPQQTSNLTSQSLVESYPWIEYKYTQENYTKKSNFKTMSQIEDVSLGKNFTAGLGLLHQQFGSDDNQLKLSTRFANGYELNGGDLAFLDLSATGYLGNGLLEGEQVSLTGEWYAFNDTGNDKYVSGRILEKSNLLPGEQILLGGESGLRGYPKGYQTGNKSALMTAEKRFHFNWYPLSVAKFGAVVFADVGTAWGGNNDSRVLADVGVGLRMVPTRSSSAKTLHFDLAIPLNDRDKVDSFQFLVKTRKSF